MNMAEGYTFEMRRDGYNSDNRRAIERRYPHTVVFRDPQVPDDVCRLIFADGSTIEFE